MSKLNKTLLIVLVLILFIISAFLGFYILNQYFGNKDFKNSDLIKNDASNLEDTYLALSNLEYPIINKSIEEQQERIKDDTTLVYEYYYTGDGKTEKTEEKPPYFLIDMTQDELKENYSDWEILEFNNKKVVMKKTIEGNLNENFIVGEHEGYIAVFYENKNNTVNLKEVTDTPVTSLSDDEQTRIKTGIEVLGEKELIRLLQDYGS